MVVALGGDIGGGDIGLALKFCATEGNLSGVCFGVCYGGNFLAHSQRSSW